MMRMYLGAVFSCFFVLSACAPEVKQLQSQILELENNLVQLEEENYKLQKEINSCSSLTSTLNIEKKSREKDLSALKAKTRLFIKNEYNMLNAFSRNDELMDYIGGELISRRNQKGSNITIVNLDPFPSDSVIYKMEGIFETGTTVRPQLFRKDGDQVICVWQGPMVKVIASGKSSYLFDTPLNVFQGDYFGFYFPQRVTVTYDQRTGSHSILAGEIELGQKLPKKYNDIERNYSIGVAGFVD